MPHLIIVLYNIRSRIVGREHLWGSYVHFIENIFTTNLTDD